MGFARLVRTAALAHCVTDHDLKSAPRATWERIAHDVEDELESVPRPASHTMAQAEAAPAPPSVAR
jgi:hypothetical protein